MPDLTLAARAIRLQGGETDDVNLIIFLFTPAFRKVVGLVVIPYNLTIRLNEIRSISSTRNLMQQICGCGDIVISTAATCRGVVVLKNINRPGEIFREINRNR